MASITGEDKCVRVFSLNHDGQLGLLNERYMPKRPCAIAITPDDAHIICGDKFGDVYALPLVPKSGSLALDQPMTPQPEAPDPSSIVEAQEPLVAATTVHLMRNKRAREQQLQSASKMPKQKDSESPGQLLLGHVSMLTDILLASLEHVSETGSKTHHYIITCDRDEHIRVSRGLPQTHVIESYCLGHKEFVTKLLVPELYPEILISGGGEKVLYLWHWATGAFLKTADISEVLMDFVKSNPGLEERNVTAISPNRDGPAEQARPENEEEDASNKGGNSYTSDNSSDHVSAASEDGSGRPVCGIWDLTASSSSEGQTVKSCRIIVALEGVPALFDLCLASDGSLKHENTLKLAGNVLDATTFKDETSLIVSIDNVHQPFSTTAVRVPEVEHEPLLQCFTLETTGSNMEWREMHDFKHVDRVSMHGSFEVTQAKSSRLGDALYALENIRKREME